MGDPSRRGGGPNGGLRGSLRGTLGGAGLRILHTADWHVGRGIRGRSRAEEHSAVLSEISELASEASVDIVLVAGDLFDSVTPSPEAERIVYGSLLRLAEAGCQVVALAGNHDNPHRLDAVAPFLKLAAIHCRAHLARPEEGGVLRLSTESGETAQIALIPFMSQRNIVRASDLMDPEQSAGHHSQSYDARCKAIVGEMCRGFEAATVNIVMAHLMVEGGTLGGGERAVHTVMDYYVTGHAFPIEAQYVALGHVHKCQKVPAPCPAVWYCGSPLSLDFGESAAEESCVLLVDASPGRPAKVEKIPLSAGRRLRTIRGTYDELLRRAGDEGDDYLRVVVESAVRAGLADDIRSAYPNAVDVMVAAGAPEDDARRPAIERLGDDPAGLFEQFLAEQGIDDRRLPALLNELLEESHAAAQA